MGYTWKFVRLLKRVFVITFTSCLVSNTIGCIARITSDFMQPLLSPEGVWDIVLLSHLPVIFNRIKCGDVIVFRSPANYHELITGRVRFIGGDIFTTDDDDFEPRIMPENHYWVVCNVSGYDSRNFGPIPKYLVLSRVAAIIWPPSRIRYM